MEREQERIWKERLKKGKQPDPAIESILFLTKGVQFNSMLDVGCGSGALMSALRKKCKCEGIDISKTALQQAKRKGLKVKHTDLDQGLPPGKNSFELVTAVQVLQHSFEPSVLLKEMSRVSKKYVAISIPNHLWWKFRLKMFFGVLPEEKFGRSGHIRLYSYRSIKEMLSSAGLRVIKEQPAGTFPFARLIPKSLRIIRFTELWPSLFAVSFNFLCEKKM